MDDTSSHVIIDASCDLALTLTTWFYLLMTLRSYLYSDYACPIVRVS